VEAAGTGVWTFICTSGIQSIRFPDVSMKNPGSATRQNRDFSTYPGNRLDQDYLAPTIETVHCVRTALLSFDEQTTDPLP
jgi:hypothetical protein